MSLKIKIPAIVALMLLINGIILFTFNRLYFLKKLAERISLISGKNIDVEKIGSSDALLELLIFELAVLTLIFIAIGVVIFFLYAKPMMQLHGMVAAYGNGSEMTAQIQETNRRDEIGQLQNAFARLAQNLIAEKQAQNRMIASISHDIKTPLTSVLGYSEKLIKKEQPDERKRHYLQIVHGSAMDIENIVSEFDEYITGKLATRIISSNYKIAYIAQMLNEEFLVDGVRINVINQCDPEDDISVDISKLRRVFTNLIGNALKHNKYSEDLQIDINLSHAGGFYKFSVSDNGAGVSQESFAYIFEPFYTTENREAISGLGLSICKDIVEHHGGKITAGNTEPRGFKVSCFFPKTSTHGGIL